MKSSGITTAAFSLGLISAVIHTATAQGIEQGEVIDSEAASFRVEVVAEGLEIPWAMAFLGDGSALVGERHAGRLQRLDIESGTLTQIGGLPDMLRNADIGSGLFDVRTGPDFQTDGQVYLAYAVGTPESNGLAVARAKLDGDALIDVRTLFESSPRLNGKYHFGGRIVIDDGYLFVSVGEGYDFLHLAQDLSAHAGSIVRLHTDGSIPSDNPFVNRANALPEIWSYGSRNAQGMAIHPDTGMIWSHEHGPQGGDEINIVRPGRNYGWPVITYGEQYGGGPIGEGITRRDGMEQPIYYWRPSIAPSGMEFYTGAAFPNWKGNLFVGALAKTHINRLVIDGERVLHEERLLDDREWRVRFIEQGPDGFLYFGVDDGMILRLVPAN